MILWCESYAILTEHEFNRRVTELSVRCSEEEEESEWCPIDMETLYWVALPDFLAEGGSKRVYNFEEVIENRVPGNRQAQIWRAKLKAGDQN